MPRPRILLITPHDAAANTGNWHTAARWRRFLADRYRVLVQQSWDGRPGALMIALHARRSADSIARFAAAHPDRPRLLVLTGTDLYRDLPADPLARRSLQLATRVVVLNRLGPRRLPAALRARTDVILQSAGPLAARPARRPPLRVAVVGHLRAEKDPALVFACVDALAGLALQVDHCGAALDPQLGRAAAALMARDPRYRWHGDVPRRRARVLMQRATVLLHPSRMEGGAQAVIEAITSGTPVIASRIDGNVGLLGSDYPGLFPVGNAAAAARLLRRVATDPAFLRALRRATARLAPAFTPAREAAALRRVVDTLLRVPRGTNGVAPRTRPAARRPR